MNLETAFSAAACAVRPALGVVLSILIANPTLSIAQTTSISASNWGTVTAPVYGTSEAGVYSQAELFAGPQKFGSYYSGVLPSGAMVKPAGSSIQIGMNPLGMAVTADGRFLLSTNDDERETNYPSYQKPGTNVGGYTLTVIDTASLAVVSKITTGLFYIGLQVTGTGPYKVWASGGGDNDVKIYDLSNAGVLTASTPARVAIAPITAPNAGYVSNYVPDAALNTADASGNKPPVPSGFSRTAGAQITFPAGSALSPNGRYLYVACNGDNSVAVIDTTTNTVVRQVPVGYFPYGISVSQAGDKVVVSNWGVSEYKFAKPTYDATSGKLTSVGTTGNQPDGLYVPVTSTTGTNPKTSSVSILSAPAGNGASLSLLGSLYQGHPLDALQNVGDTHPSANAIVRQGTTEVLYVTKTNSDSIGMVLLNNNRALPDFDLSPIALTLSDGHSVHGAYPNAIAVSPDNKRVYIAEAGISSIAVLDTTDPVHPKLVGRLGTGWYPTAVTVSPDGRYLYVANAKGIGEDVNPAINTSLPASAPASGLVSDPTVDSNYIFGSLQKIDLAATSVDNATVLANNYALHPNLDTSVMPLGGTPSAKIKHVFFILHENKTFDSMLGNLSTRFGPFAGLTFNNGDGSQYTNKQFTGVDLNFQSIASKFAVGANYYSNAEESDAGHQFAASGTSSDYTQKTLLVKSNRGLLVNKNFEPEDYPEGGYIFNNAARHGVSFKDYGALVRIEGTDTGTSTPTTVNDPTSGNAGFPQVTSDATGYNVRTPLMNAGDTETGTVGLGQSYFLSLPILSILGSNNTNGEPRLDRNYPGYNFNISDQRRAQEFIKDFDRMAASNTLPTYIYIYQPNDHTGGIQSPNGSAVSTSASLPFNEVADCDTGLGMVVNHIMSSPVYYDSTTGEGSAIFVTFDDAQSSLDHIHPHRTPLVVISPYAKPAYTSYRHYVTASIVKSEELLLGLPPNNLGDLFATDLRDMFQATYNGITASAVPVTRMAPYQTTFEGSRIWAMVDKLDTSAPDRDSRRLGALTRYSIAADDLHRAAARKGQLKSKAYRASQARLYEQAKTLVSSAAPRDTDD